MTTAPVNGL